MWPQHDAVSTTHAYAFGMENLYCMLHRQLYTFIYEIFLIILCPPCEYLSVLLSLHNFNLHQAIWFMFRRTAPGTHAGALACFAHHRRAEE